MNIEKKVDILMGDLANEYSHMHFYMQAATNIKGLHRQEIGEFFSEQASSEMKHVDDEVRKRVLAEGGAVPALRGSDLALFEGLDSGVLEAGADRVAPAEDL